MSSNPDRRKKAKRLRSVQGTLDVLGAASGKTTASRSCNGCTACCVAMGVAELDKQPFSACRFAEDGQGCGCYETRPESCRNYQCIWVQGALPDAFWPKLSGVVMDMGRPRSGTFREDDLPLTLREVRDGALDAAPMKAFIEKVKRKRVVILFTKDSRRLLGPPEKLRALETD
jgi:hypothetical protein